MSMNAVYPRSSGRRHFGLRPEPQREYNPPFVAPSVRSHFGLRMPPSREPDSSSTGAELARMRRRPRRFRITPLGYVYGAIFFSFCVLVLLGRSQSVNETAKPGAVELFGEPAPQISNKPEKLDVSAQWRMCMLDSSPADVTMRLTTNQELDPAQMTFFLKGLEDEPVAGYFKKLREGVAENPGDARDLAMNYKLALEVMMRQKNQPDFRVNVLVNWQVSQGQTCDKPGQLLPSG